MSKVMLVFDEPKGCGKCPILSMNVYDGETVCWCGVTNIDVTVFDETYPIWCPLRPVPRKKVHVNKHIFNEDFVKGWNLCVDFIEGAEDV